MHKNWCAGPGWFEENVPLSIFLKIFMTFWGKMLLVTGHAKQRQKAKPKFRKVIIFSEKRNNDTNKCVEAIWSIEIFFSLSKGEVPTPSRCWDILVRSFKVVLRALRACPKPWKFKKYYQNHQKRRYCAPESLWSTKTTFLCSWNRQKRRSWCASGISQYC